MKKISRRDFLKQASMLGFTLPIALTTEPGAVLVWSARENHPTWLNRPVCPLGAPPELATFIDPTVTITSAENITLAQHIYIGPFAQMQANSNAKISIGAESNAQDNTTILAGPERDAAFWQRIAALGLHENDGVHLVERCVLAHGATVKGPARLGEGSASHSEVFLSFGAEVDGAILERDTQVSQLARVGPGVRLRSGFVVLPGKNVTTQEEAGNVTLGKVRLITDADRAFVDAVIEVNNALAREYTRLFAEQSSNVYGINYNPGHTGFSPHRDLPTLGGRQTRDPNFRNRIIGEISLADKLDQLSPIMGKRIALRADEGAPFQMGHFHMMQDNVIFHALEHADLHIGNNVTYGARVIVHGGLGALPNGQKVPTAIEDDVVLKDQALVYKAHIGHGCVIGKKSMVINSVLAPGTVIPDQIVYQNNAFFGAMEW